MPPELTNSVVFSDSKGDAIGTVLGSDIRNVSALTETKGRIAKRQDQVIEIVYEQRTIRGEHIAILKIEDKYISDILQAINVIKSNVADEIYWTYRSLTFTAETDHQTKTIGIYFLAPFMAQEEEIVWENTVFGKQNKLSWTQLITNYRIYEYDFNTHQGRALLFPGLEDIVVMNQRRTSKSNTVATYARSRYMVAGSGNTNTTSRTLGDLVFIFDGKPFVTFSQISDPHGLARLLKSI